MTDGKSATELQKLGYRKATVWVVDRDNKEATERWRESARLAAGADERDGTNAFLEAAFEDALADESDYALLEIRGSAE